MSRPNPPLRVAFDQRLAGYRAGGITRYAVELGRALDLRDDIALTPLRHHKDEFATDSDLRLRTPPHHRLEPIAVGLELALSRRPFDVYHATDFVAPRLLRLPVVTTVHDLAFLRWPDQLERDALRYYRQVTGQARRTAHWITPSEWTRAELVDLVGIDAADITVIPHGVSGFITPDAIKRRAQREPYIVAVGTIEPRKRYGLLLDAFERLSPGMQLHIIGAAGWNTHELQRRLRATLGVTWHANAGDAQLDRLVAGATALAIPSLAEGFGLGALEAMARGTPVISSGLGALSEVTGQAAEIPSHDDPASWAEAIERVAQDDQLWERLSTDGARRARQFTWQSAAQRTAEVYWHVAG